MGEKLPFLDKTGVIRLWQHILAKIGVKADKTELEELEETLTQQIKNIDLSGYETTNDAAAKLTEAKNYADEKTANLITSDAADGKISTHNVADDAHNDIRVLISDLSTAVNNFLDVDDTTTDQLSEVLELIANNKGTLESLTTSKINVADIINNLTTNSTDKVLSAAQGVAIKGLIDEKADEEHNHDDRYYTETKIDNMVFITTDDIDTICGAVIYTSDEVIL